MAGMIREVIGNPWLRTGQVSCVGEGVAVTEAVAQPRMCRPGGFQDAAVDLPAAVLAQLSGLQRATTRTERRNSCSEVRLSVPERRRICVSNDVVTREAIVGMNSGRQNGMQVTRRVIKAALKGPEADALDPTRMGCIAPRRPLAVQ